MNRQQALRALAYLTEAAREEAGHNPWNQAGIYRALQTIPATRTIAAITTAAITAATTRPDQNTPAVIALDGPHWPTATGSDYDPWITPPPLPAWMHDPNYDQDTTP